MRTIVAALALCVATAAGAQVPDTPAGRQLAGWLRAFNAADADSLRLFLGRSAPGASGNLLQATPGLAGFRERTGGFDFRKVEESTPVRLVALVQERVSDQIARTTIDVKAEAPHHITAISIEAIPRPADLAVARMTDADLASALRTKLERDAAAGLFSGAVLVARDGRTLVEGAYGLADREKGTANTIDTRFRIGSMNKMFTAVATLQLVQAGKLRLDAPIGTYLTDYPNKDVASKVTIHHLLTHTGGTGDIFGPQFTAKRTELRNASDYLSLYGTRAPEFEPGSRFAYSNYGFVLLGAVIEKVSGKSYHDYVAANVFAPAGMTSSGSEPEETPVPNRSRGYMRDRAPGSRGVVSNAGTLPWRGTSAGGGYSTVRDLGRFAAALRGHKLLNARHTELLITGKVDARGEKYAYGFFDRTVGGTRYVGHGGGAPGMNGDLAIDPRSGTVVAVLANLDPPAAGRVAEFVLNRLPSASLQP